MRVIFSLACVACMFALSAGCQQNKNDDRYSKSSSGMSTSPTPQPADAARSDPYRPAGSDPYRPAPDARTASERQAQPAQPAQPPQPAQPAAGDASAEAQTLLDQTTQYIQENKLDMAEKTLSQVEQMKPRLPSSYHGKIDSVRSMLDAAKGAGKSWSGVPGGR